MALKTWETHPQDFALHFYPYQPEDNSGWLWTQYHEIIGDTFCEYLPKAKRDRKVYYIFVSLPPRGGKTEFVDAISIPWAFNLYPGIKVLLLTHTISLSYEYSIRIRDFIKEHNGELRVQVRKGEEKAEEWATMQGGRFKCAGLGTGIQGKGYNIITLDDLIKNRQAANSEAVRRQIRMLLTGTIRGRFDPRWGIMWVPMTRWDNQDPAAYIQEIMLSSGRKDQLVMMNFPAISLGVKEDPLGRREGEPLGPIFTSEGLKEIREFCTEQEWWAQYMGMPRADLGSFFPESKFRHYTKEGDYYKWLSKSGEVQSIAVRDSRIKTYQFWDTAITDTENSAYSVCVTAKIWNNGEKPIIMVFDVYRKKIAVSELLEEIQRLKNLHSPIKVFVEDVPGSKHLLQSAEKQGVPLYPLKTEGKSKEERAIALQHYYQSGSVLHLKKVDGEDVLWLKPFEAEMIAFPGKYKDQVDAFVYCAIALNNNELTVVEMRSGFGRVEASRPTDQFLPKVDPRRFSR